MVREPVCTNLGTPPKPRIESESNPALVRSVTNRSASLPTLLQVESSVPDIYLLGAVAFESLIASDEILEVFVRRLDDCTGLLGALWKAPHMWEKPLELDT